MGGRLRGGKAARRFPHASPARRARSPVRSLGPQPGRPSPVGTGRGRIPHFEPHDPPVEDRPRVVGIQLSGTGEVLDGSSQISDVPPSAAATVPGVPQIRVQPDGLVVVPDRRDRIAEVVVREAVRPRRCPNSPAPSDPVRPARSAADTARRSRADAAAPRPLARGSAPARPRSPRACRGPRCRASHPRPPRPSRPPSPRTRRSAPRSSRRPRSRGCRSGRRGRPRSARRSPAPGRARGSSRAGRHRPRRTARSPSSPSDPCGRRPAVD
jgi:hypothetical protein